MVVLEDFVEKMIKLDKCKKEDKELIIYGLTMGFEAVANFTTLVLIGLAFNLIIEGIVFYISFSAIRTYAGGYHCKKGVNCYLSSSFIMVLFYVILKFMPLQYMGTVAISVLVVSLPILVKYAPIATDNNPMEDIERRHFRKKVIINLIIEVLVITALFLVGWINYTLTVTLGILASSILVFIEIFTKNNNIKY